MKTYKSVLDRVSESQKIEGRINFNLHRYNLELDNCDHENVSEAMIVYHFFGHECDTPSESVKKSMFAYITDNYVDIAKAASTILADKKTELFDYITRLSSDDCRADFLVIYVLSKMYDVHTGVICKDNVWFTFQGEGSISDCGHVFVFLGGNRFKHATRLHLVRDLKITFEAGEKVPVDSENEDPSYRPGSSYATKGSRHKMTKVHKPRRKTRKAAMVSYQKTKQSAYREPDYVVEVSEDEGAQARHRYEDDPDYVVEIPTSSEDSDEVEADPDTGDHTDFQGTHDEEAISKVSHDSQRPNTEHVATYMDTTEEYDVNEYLSKNCPNVQIMKVKKIAKKKTKSNVRVVAAKSFNFGIRRKFRPKKCNLCTKTFKTYALLTKHKLDDHAARYQCNQCARKFSSNGSLNNHYQRHTPLRLKHVCDKCGKRFLRPSGLKLHETGHTVDIWYRCTWKKCGKKYMSNNELKRHIKRDHTDVVILQCPNCVLTFNSKKKLTQHAKGHAQPSIPCSVCGKLFTHYSSRNNHQKKCVLVE